MSRDDDSDARVLVSVSPEVLTEAALRLDRELEDTPGLRRMRRRRHETEDDASEPTRLRALEDRVRDLDGGGGNGKVGNLRGEVLAIKGLLKWVAAGLASALLAAGGAIYQSGQETGAKKQELEYLRTEVARLRDEVRDLRATPAMRPPFWNGGRGDTP